MNLLITYLMSRWIVFNQVKQLIQFQRRGNVSRWHHHFIFYFRNYYRQIAVYITKAAEVIEIMQIGCIALKLMFLVPFMDEKIMKSHTLLKNVQHLLGVFLKNSVEHPQLFIPRVPPSLGVELTNNSNEPTITPI